MGGDDLVRQRQHLDVGLGLGKRDRVDCLRRGGGIGQHGIHDRLIGATAVGSDVHDRCGDHIAVMHDRAVARLDEATERDERVTAGHDAGVDEERDRAVRGDGRAWRRDRGRAAPHSHAAAGDRVEIAGEVGPHRAADRAEVAEGLEERGAADREVAGGAGGGQQAELADSRIFKNDGLHARKGRRAPPVTASGIRGGDRPRRVSLAIGRGGP